MKYETIRIDRDPKGYATITLSRPEKHNAMNAAMISELTDAALRLGAEKNVRAVVLASEGKSFCAGGDLEWMRAQFNKTRSGKMDDAKALASMLRTLNELPKPLIGRVQGPAYGGGIGLMAVCDIVIAADSAKFALTETRLGLIPATIGPFVVSKMGEGYARQVFHTGRPFDAAFALQSGLVSRVTTAEDIDNAIATEIEPILKTRPGAVAAAKALCLTLGRTPHELQFQVSAEALADCWESEEAQEGISAFLSRT
jgi:methylglutaconyl-CoA hydratase